MRKVSYIVSALILAGCGGGGDSPAPAPTVSIQSNPPPATPPPTTTVEKPYFSEVSNPLTVKLPFANTMATNVSTLDVNGDNRLDLVVHYYEGNFNNQKNVTTHCKNELRVYILQPDNTFAEQTSAYVTNGNDLGGCSRKTKKADINGDGKIDLVYAINQEDGRDQSNVSLIQGPLAALVSVGNTYVIRKFNFPRWYHSVGVGVDDKGRSFVTGAGYTYAPYDAEFVFDSQGNQTEISLDIPKLSANSFELYNLSGSKTKETDILVHSGFEGNPIVIQAWVKKNGAWTKLPDHNPYGDVIGKFSDSDFYIHKLNGQTIAAAAISETCVTKINPNDEPIVIHKMHYQVVKNFVNGMPMGNSIDIPSSLYRGTRIENNKIVEVDLNIKDEIRDNVNINFFSCIDVNNDGYNDIVSYQYSNTGLPDVYINNKDNSFKNIGQKMFPNTYKQEFGNIYSSILEDFDNDGFADLFVWHANGTTAAEPVKFRFYKGQKKITD